MMCVADWTQFVLWFFIYSFIGWVYETILCSVIQKQFVNRGTMNGPYCPIYGFGALIVYVCLGRVDNILLLFVGSMLLTGILEYFTSWALEALFQARWWDYSDQKFNLNGRVFLGGALVFGTMSVLVVKVVQPILISFTLWIPSELRHTLAGLLVGFFSVDLVISYLAHRGFTRKLREANERLEAALADYLAIVEAEDWSLKKEISEWREAQAQQEERAFMQRLADIEARVAASREDGRIPSLRRHISDLAERLGKQERRNLKSFPKFRSMKHSDILDAIRESGDSIE